MPILLAGVAYLGVKIAYAIGRDRGYAEARAVFL